MTFSALSETELKDGQTLRTTYGSPAFQTQQRPAANKLRVLAKNMHNSFKYQYNPFCWCVYIYVMTHIIIITSIRLPLSDNNT